jgi:hypothetical protein
MFSNASIPVFFSEYGCNEVTPRVFEEVEALYSPQMTVMSGGLVYEWSQEENNYGLIEIHTNGSAQLLADFASLQQQYSRINITRLEANNATATGIRAPRCASDLISADGFSNDFDIPARPAGAAALISSGVSDAPKGALVSVTATMVALPVYDVAGAPIRNLAITPTTQANLPTRTASRTSGTQTASGAASTGAGRRLSGAAAVALGAAVFAL